MAFQNTAPAALMAPGMEGGFSGDNPIFTLTNPDEGQWLVGTTGLYIGRFAWGNTATGLATSAHPGVSTVRIGFVGLDQPAYITGLLNASSLQMTAGQGVDLFEDAPVWGRFAAGASVGNKVYAYYADGSLYAAATATPPTASVAVTTANTSTALTSVGAGAYAGQPISGAGIPASTFLVSVNATAGTAVMSNAATATASITATVTTAFETTWTVRSNCLSGEVAKISVRG